MKRIVVTFLAVALLVFGLPIGPGAVDPTLGQAASVDSLGAGFWTGANCGAALASIAVLAGGLVGVFTLGAGAVIGLGIGGMIAGAQCN